MTTVTMPIARARVAGASPKRPSPKNVRPGEHSRVFSPIPELWSGDSGGDPLVRWKWVCETAIKAALPIYLLLALATILAL
jgi:hypothetical protein